MLPRTFASALRSAPRRTTARRILARLVHPELQPDVDQSSRRVAELNRLLGPDGWTFRVTAGRVFFDSPAGYAPARLRFRGRGALFAAVIAVMAVPGVVLLIPKFLVLNQLGTHDSYSGMIVPLPAATSPLIASAPLSNDGLLPPDATVLLHRD